MQHYIEGLDTKFTSQNSIKLLDKPVVYQAVFLFHT